MWYSLCWQADEKHEIVVDLVFISIRMTKSIVETSIYPETRYRLTLFRSRICPQIPEKNNDHIFRHPCFFVVSDLRLHKD